MPIPSQLVRHGRSAAGDLCGDVGFVAPPVTGGADRKLRRATIVLPKAKR